MTNPAVEALKPCPFCGSENVGLVDALGMRWGKCGDCLASGSAIDDPDKPERSIRAWNRRAQAEQTPVAGRLINEELYRQLERCIEVIDDEDISGFSYYDGTEHKYVTLTEIEDALRASPSFPKEGE